MSDQQFSLALLSSFNYILFKVSTIGETLYEFELYFRNCQFASIVSHKVWV